MNTVIHHSEDRGKGEYGWLSTRYSFSFGSWYNQARLGFGALLVINDDTIAAGTGFGAHSHDNMEIITVVTGGTLAHKDSIGTEGVVQAGEVQVMSAGTGITHSEFNHSNTEPLTLFQIWIQPSERNVAPRYDQRAFELQEGLQPLVGPMGAEGVLNIHQDAYITRATLTTDTSVTYDLHSLNNGVYAFVVQGSAIVSGTPLRERDALGINDGTQVELSTATTAELLLIEVPMQSARAR